MRAATCVALTPGADQEEGKKWVAHHENMRQLANVVEKPPADAKH